MNDYSRNWLGMSVGHKMKDAQASWEDPVATENNPAQPSQSYKRRQASASSGSGRRVRTGWSALRVHLRARELVAPILRQSCGIRALFAYRLLGLLFRVEGFVTIWLHMVCALPSRSCCCRSNICDGCLL